MDTTPLVLEALARIVTGDVDRSGWPPAVSAVLGAIPALELERYAGSLLDKRTSELRRAIPVTARAFPPVIATYRAWLARNPAVTVDHALPPGLHEALRALPVLVDAIDVEWLREVLAFEVYRAASRRDHVVRRLSAEYPVHALFQALSGGEVPVHPDPEPHRYRFAERVQWRTP